MVWIVRYGAIINGDPILIRVGNDKYFLKSGDDRYQIIDTGSEYNLIKHCISSGCGGANVPEERTILKKKGNSVGVEWYLQEILDSFNEGNLL